MVFFFALRALQNYEWTLLLYNWSKGKVPKRIKKTGFFWKIYSNCIDRICVSSLFALVLFLSTVRFQMSPQMVCPRGGIIALIAFVRLFSAVRFQMCPQMTCLRGCIITLVAFVWLFSTVRFQMCPQMACLRRCIVTLVAFV